ncbi:MAG: ATP-dependent DNA ligase [Mesorhizobium sp.]|uniref:ATP-dependent DNA ligase n=1 Tax=Mesorhizobium sp. TaxID=1871066 RepID=UPI000FE7AD20|nr:ATP-dependent DNA ligase [Mesorhizobium sp.]RWH86468.1 MAG: ATP-dependent DNA ligase [Mesorhizobium sp.]RWM32292.1 MAG: ATP-dependent DNA ligase [Mesorhizobium sp.]TJV33792.1 MAG: ATP-dependent DNA ligase [Mesorhizobium sp.]
MRLTFIPPMEPKLVAKPPGGDDWIHEIKLDGYRAQVVINSPEDIRVYTKTGADWTSKFAGLVEAAREIEVENAIIDGEAVVTNEAGLPDFGALQKAVHSDPYAMILGAFDILHLNGHDLRDIGCKARREILYGKIKPNSRIQFSEAMPGDAKAIFYLVDQAGIEGIVSKRADSKYRSGPTSNWLKTKSFTVDEFELIGVEREPGKAAFALLAEPGTGKYVGSAFITLGRDMRERLWKRVQEHAGPPPKEMKNRPATQWVEPGLKLRVKHLRGDHSHIRHASLLGFGDE